MQSATSATPVRYEQNFSVLPHPPLPDPMSFTNKAENEKITLCVTGHNLNQVFGIYRIASYVLHLQPATNELGSRLLGQASSESFWTPSLVIQQIFFRFKDKSTLELSPGSFDLIERNFTIIRGLAEERKIDLIRTGSILTIKEL